MIFGLVTYFRRGALVVCQDSFEGLVRIILDLDYRRCYADGFWAWFKNRDFWVTKA